MGHPEQNSSSGSNASLVILIALVVLSVPCLGGLFLAGLGFFWVSASQPPAGVRQAAPVQVATELMVEPEPGQLPEMSTEPASELPSQTDTERAIEQANVEGVGPKATAPAGAPAASLE
jgi:hypothetical protein